MAAKKEPEKIVVNAKRDTTAPHPLWSGWPGRLQRDRAWRADILMAAAEPEWIEPLYVEGTG